MTLIAGIVCDDGVVLAAESATSDFESGTKQPTTKIKRLGAQRVMYAGSGDVGLLQKIDAALTGFIVPPGIKRARQDLRSRIFPALEEGMKFHTPYPQVGLNVPPSAVLLFAFICAGRPCLLEIEKDGRDTLYDDVLGNFAAIGGGKPWAQTIFRPFLYTPRTLELGKVFAYRILNDAIDLAMMGLARPVRIWTLPANGGDPALVDDQGMERLAEVRQVWQQMEAEAVGRLLQPHPEREEPIPSPKPLVASDSLELVVDDAAGEAIYRSETIEKADGRER